MEIHIILYCIGIFCVHKPGFLVSGRIYCYSAIMRRGKILVNSLSPRIGGEIFGEFGFKS